MPDELSVESPRPLPLTVAVVLVALAGACLLLVGLGAILQFHGRFSLGVGAMLVIYSLGVLAAAWLGWKRSMLAFGAMMSVTLLHVAVVASTAKGSRVWWLLLAEVPLAATIVCLVWPSTLRALGRVPRAED